LHVAKKERRVERNYTIAKTAILVGNGRGSRRTLRSIRNYTGSTIRSDSHSRAVDGSTDRNQPQSECDFGANTIGTNTKRFGHATTKLNESRWREYRSNDGYTAGESVAGSGCCSVGTGEVIP